MKKVDAAELLEEIGNDLVIYLRKGFIKMESFLQKVDPQIDGLRKLLNIHFVLQDEVLDFIEQLPFRLRRLKTATRKKQLKSRGLVQGRVLWGDTLRERSQRNPLDRTLHISEYRTRHLQIKENSVLIRLLSVIRDILVFDIRPMQDKSYEWLQNWTETGLMERFIELVERNIYLQQLEPVEVTDRMINDTSRSRSALYRDAADLLKLYRDLTNPHRWRNVDDYEERITRLLRTTFISPDDKNTLFELYWTIRLMRDIGEKATLHLIEPGSKQIASAEDEDYRYRIYHDSTGSANISFQVGLNELAGAENEYARRIYWSRNKLKRLGPELLGQTADRLWSGRPDILVEVRSKETGPLEKILIGEVKNTVDRKYAMDGLRELLDYMALAKHRGEYLSSEDSTCKVIGMLCVNNMWLDSSLAENVLVRTLQQKTDLSHQLL